MKVLFFISMFMIAYIYIGYPFLVSVFTAVRTRGVKKDETLPFVTILIAAYNEEKSIEATLRNKLALEYPLDKLEVIVISDGSTDTTEEIVRRYEKQGVKLIRQFPRAGKTSGLNLAAPHASGEILVFSDANSIYEKEALRRLMQSFHDPEVGYVTGKMIYTNADGAAVGDGCSAYMKYENFLRRMESRLGSVVGVDGGIDAVRKVLYKPMRADQLPDFVLPLSVVKQGFRVVYEPDAVLQEAALNSSKDEYRMRVRVSLRALWALRDMSELLSFHRSKLFAWQLWSHKALRYLCFLFLLGAYAGNLALWSEGVFYRTFLVAQTMAYAAALISPVMERRGCRPFYLFHYFFLLNWASMHAFIKFMLGRKQVMWTPRKG
jgi:cellulose synthase/poly-beta-1,6-N-acetylglucosamine synthase-like glycosyltransferase